MVLIEGEVILTPLPTNVPPVVAEYQSIVSFVETAPDNVTVPVPHLETSETVGALGDAVIDNTAALDNKSVVQVPLIKHWY